MGEYLNYKGENVKIGTLENLYYTSYDRYVKELEAGRLSPDGSTSPEFYVLPDSGFRFRFPFPDEDQLPFCNIIEPYNRGVSISIDQAAIPDDKLPGPYYKMEIIQQKLIQRQSDGKPCLALIWRDPVNDEKYRVEDEADIKAIVRQIVRNHIADENDPEKKNFYRQVAARILKGYRIDAPKKTLTNKAKQPLRTLPYKRTNRSKRKGL